MRGIYRYTLDWGRHGTAHGLFIADDLLVASAREATVQLGSLFGKHSEVTDDGDGKYDLLSTEPADLDMFERLKLETGVNPVAHYLDQQYDEDEDEDA